MPRYEVVSTDPETREVERVLEMDFATYEEAKAAVMKAREHLPRISMKIQEIEDAKA